MVKNNQKLKITTHQMREGMFTDMMSVIDQTRTKYHSSSSNQIVRNTGKKRNKLRSKRCTVRVKIKNENMRKKIGRKQKSKDGKIMLTVNPQEMKTVSKLWNKRIVIVVMTQK